MEEGSAVYSTCGEIFQYEDHEFDVGERYYSGVVKHIKPLDLVSDYAVENILEQMDEALYEEVGEVAGGSLDLADTHKVELMEIIKCFMKDHAGVSCFKVVNIEEHIKGEE